MIDQSTLKSLVRYDPDSGIFIRMKSGGGKKVGDKAGTITPGGYVVISLLGKNYLAHRLAFMYMTGHFPENQVDHINNVKHDNRFINLRKSTASQNQCNKFKYANNTSGHKGVSFRKRSGRWRATIRKDNIQYDLGEFRTIEEAIDKINSTRFDFHEDFSKY